MERPVLRAEAICHRYMPSGGVEVMVQCDHEETFYRFPGGMVEFGETAAQAIAREMIEEYDLSVRVKTLVAVSEAWVQTPERCAHQVTLLHHCELTAANEAVTTYIHSEDSAVKLVWRPLTLLGQRRVVPDGILSVLKGPIGQVLNLIVGFDPEHASR